jgi:toxin ParE1/3/4
MTKRIRLTEQAEEDVLEIWEYIASDNLSAADRLVDRFDATYQKLAQTPGMGVKQEQFRAGLRCFPVGKYPFSTQSLTTNS